MRRQEAIRARILLKQEWTNARIEKAKKTVERHRKRELARERRMWELKQKLKAQEIQRIENESAILIQCLYRQFIARKKLSRILLQQFESFSATVIQRYFRKRRAIKKVRLKRYLKKRVRCCLLYIMIVF